MAVFRYFILSLLLSICASPALGLQGQVLNISDQMCTLAGGSELSPDEVLERAAAFDCGELRMETGADHLWLIVDVTETAGLFRAPQLILNPSRQTAIDVHQVFADGRVLAHTYDARDLTEHWHAVDRVRFALAGADAGPLDTLLISISEPWDPANWGPIEIAEMEIAEERHLTNTIIAGLLSGMLFAPLLLNLVFIFVLRHRFIVFHSVMTLCVMIYAVSWSGLIFPLIPSLDYLGRSTLNHLVIPVAFLAACFLTYELCEPGKLGRLAHYSLMGAGAVPLAGGIFFMAASPRFAHLGSMIYHGLFAIPLIVIAGCLIVARLRGSHMALIQLFGWSGVFMLVVGRVFQGLGLIPHQHIFDVGFLPVLIFETIITTLTVAYRMLLLRRELDAAVRDRANIMHIAETDYLTNIPNRRAFVERFDLRLGQAERRRHVSALIVLDLDHFKSFNDNYGHETGDLVLKQFAALLDRECRAQDICARIGGEEFAMLVHAPSARDVVTAAERICRLVAAERFGHENQEIGQVTVSIGLAHIDKTKPFAFKQYYMLADEALYKAKENGRNRVEVVAPEADNESVRAEDTQALAKTG